MNCVHQCSRWATAIELPSLTRHLPVGAPLLQSRRPPCDFMARGRPLTHCVCGWGIVGDVGGSSWGFILLSRQSADHPGTGPRNCHQNSSALSHQFPGKTNYSSMSSHSGSTQGDSVKWIDGEQTQGKTGDKYMWVETASRVNLNRTGQSLR